MFNFVRRNNIRYKISIKIVNIKITIVEKTFNAFFIRIWLLFDNIPLKFKATLDAIIEFA